MAQGFDPETVRRVSNLLDLAEYKRRQAPPGVKITRKAFGRDRRYPITNAFRRVGLRDLPAGAGTLATARRHRKWHSVCAPPPRWFVVRHSLRPLYLRRDEAMYGAGGR